MRRASRRRTHESRKRPAHRAGEAAEQRQRRDCRAGVTPIKSAQSGEGRVIKPRAHADADYEPRSDIGAKVRGKREPELPRSDRNRRLAPTPVDRRDVRSHAPTRGETIAATRGRATGRPPPTTGASPFREQSAPREPREGSRTNPTPEFALRQALTMTIVSAHSERFAPLSPTTSPSSFTNRPIFGLGRRSSTFSDGRQAARPSASRRSAD